MNSRVALDHFVATVGLRRPYISNDNTELLTWVRAFALSKSLGVSECSLLGAIFEDRVYKNRSLYGRKYRARELLSGHINAPEEVGDLLLKIRQRVHPAFSPSLFDNSGSAAVISVSVEQIVCHGPPPATRTRSPTVSFQYLTPSPTTKSSSPSCLYKGVTAPQAVRPAKRAEETYIGTARAVCDFRPEETGDLIFDKGDTIEIISRTPSRQDRWRGACKGRIGQFPAGAVEIELSRGLIC